MCPTQVYSNKQSLKHSEKTFTVIHLSKENFFDFFCGVKYALLEDI